MEKQDGYISLQMKKEGQISPHIEPSHIAVKREEERPEATAVGFVHDLAHLLSQARC